MAEKARPKSRGRPPKVAKTTHEPTIEEPLPVMGEDTQELPEVATPPTQPEWKDAAELIPEDEDQTQSNQSMETDESPQIPSPANESDTKKTHQSDSDTTSEDESLNEMKEDTMRTNSASPNREGGRQPRSKPTSQLTRDILLARGISEADLERWEEMDLSCAQISSWHKEGFRPAEAALWNQEGFSARKARQWKAIRCTVSWAVFFKEAGMLIKRAAPWRTTQMNIIGIHYALKHKISPETSLEWIKGGLGIYKAVKYHEAAVPSSFSAAIKELGMQADVLSEFFDSFRIGEVAMKWAKCGIEPKVAKLWANIGFSPEEAHPWIKHTFTHTEARTWSYTGIPPEDAATLKQ
ncbi:hypothetical protein DSO57_1026841 [Entomophthora muscae]|uniref:Uncharacterized protein n=1 Tax=Entomophthora muscae TaxID=34485 RepID=A0ACC2S3T7_9FUNG|nr:hypothetical protein DSO57_1026841 [Entomophthora muscae]